MPELLSPAGNFEKMKAALRFGADAVYLAGQQFGMRSAADNFTIEELETAVTYAHERGRKVYLTVNTMPRAGEYPALRDYLVAIRHIPLDACIVADLGVMDTIREISPDREIHISTQAGVCSPATALAYARLGARRLVLARELTFDEIRAIRRALPSDIQLEAFIHGSMCVSYSGRCMLSNELTGRDGNRGMCAQPCRWNYHLVEEKRPEQPLPIEVNDLGTFILSSKDMNMIRHVPELMESGIDSFKIEGRMKSAYYVAVVSNAYRMAMDAYTADPAGYRFDEALWRELSSVSHREYCTGYYLDDCRTNNQLASDVGYIRDKAYFAIAAEEADALPAGLSGENAQGRLCSFIQKNKLCVGDRAELLTPGKVGRGFAVTELYDESGAAVESVPHPWQKFWVRVPFPVLPGDILRAGDDD